MRATRALAAQAMQDEQGHPQRQAQSTTFDSSQCLPVRVAVRPVPGGPGPRQLQLFAPFWTGSGPLGLL
eukprot:6579591-Pyramimonas_sp.AAC.1